MRRVVVLRLAMLLPGLLAGTPSVARAADAPPPAAAPAKPPPTPTPEQAADAVLAAVAAKDDAGLKALAAKDDPDPWLVADELIRRGQHDAAERFAKAAPRKAVETLPRYVATRRSDARPDPDRAHVETVERALLAKAYEEALGLPSPASLETVSAIRVAYGQGTALQRLRRRAGARGMGGPTRPLRRARRRAARGAGAGQRRHRPPHARRRRAGPRGLRGGVGGAAERRGS